MLLVIDVGNTNTVLGVLSTGVIVGSDLPLTGNFECSNEIMNRTARNMRCTIRANLVDLPTDCPQSDERMGWMDYHEVAASAFQQHARRVGGFINARRAKNDFLADAIRESHAHAAGNGFHLRRSGRGVEDGDEFVLRAGAEEAHAHSALAVAGIASTAPAFLLEVPVETLGLELPRSGAEESVIVPKSKRGPSWRHSALSMCRQ